MKVHLLFKLLIAILLMLSIVAHNWGIIRIWITNQNLFRINLWAIVANEHELAPRIFLSNLHNEVVIGQLELI